MISFVQGIQGIQGRASGMRRIGMEEYYTRSYLLRISGLFELETLDDCGIGAS